MILEDDASIAGVLEKHLRSWDMQVYTASDFQNVLREFAAYSPQLVLLDITLPFFNGYYWCSEIRRISKVPIIFIFLRIR